MADPAGHGDAGALRPPTIDATAAVGYRMRAGVNPTAAGVATDRQRSSPRAVYPSIPVRL